MGSAPQSFDHELLTLNVFEEYDRKHVSGTMKYCHIRPERCNLSMSEVSEQVAREHYEEYRHWLDGKDRLFCRCGVKIDCIYSEAAQKMADHIATETEILLLEKSNPQDYNTFRHELSRMILSMVHDHQPDQVKYAYQASARVVTDRSVLMDRGIHWVRND